MNPSFLEEPIPSQFKGKQEALKEGYLRCLSTLSASLREVLSRLLRLGVERGELVRWAVEAGYSQSFIRNLLSRLCCRAGQRQRKAGAWRRTPPEALALLAMARDRYGERAARFLLAAYRAAKSRPHAQPAQELAA